MQSKPYVIYRALLRLYPKSFRDQYGQQILQTLDDILDEKQNSQQKFWVWITVFGELPSTILGEHINNLEEKNMGTLIKKISKRQIIVSSAIVLVAVVGIVGYLLSRSTDFTPTTLSEARTTKVDESCLQKQDNSSIKTADQDGTFIANAVTTSIIDVPAGTNVDVFLNTYDKTSAKGTAIYSGNYGSYNFTAIKTNTNSDDSYTAGWKITKFVACN